MSLATRPFRSVVRPLSARRLCLAPLLAALLLPACRPQQGPNEGAVAQVPIQSEVVARADFRTQVTLLGRVEPAARTTILAPLSGEIHFSPRFAGGLRTGERVTQGELLATITSLDREGAFREAEVAARAARNAADRAERTFAAGVLPEAEVERARFALEEAETRLENHRRSRGESQVVAPAAGILRLGREAPAPGSRVTTGTELAELASDGALEVELWAAAADLDQLTVGARVFCRLSGKAEVRGEGQLVELDRVLDDDGLARGLARIDQDLGMPRPGSGVEVTIEGEALAGLSVPELAIVRRGGIATLFVLENRGSGYLARARAVNLGPTSEGRVLVLAGLAEGERVATLGADLLTEGMMAAEAQPSKPGFHP